MPADDSNPNLSLDEKKQVLRRTIRARLRTLTEAEINERSQSIFDHLVPFFHSDARSSIACYVSMPYEVQTFALIERLISQGKEVVVPKVQKDSKQLAFYKLDSLDSLKAGAYGILEPDADPERWVPADAIEIACLPGIAFSRNGQRLGQGGGYFDRLLAQWKRSVPTIGLAFDCQIEPLIPVETHDCAVDALITESGWLKRL